MIPVVRTELRRSNAAALAVLLFATGALLIAATLGSWDRQWLVFSYEQAGGLFLLVPMALAGGAVLGGRERRTRATELMSSTGRPRWQKAAPPAAALTLAVAVVHLLTLGIGAAVIGAGGGFLDAAGAFPALVDVTVLAGAVCLGLAAGHAWSSPLLPPLLGALTLVAQAAVASTAAGSRLRALTLELEPPGAGWETFTAGALLGRLALGVGLLAGGLLLAAAASWPGRVAGVAALAAGTLLAVAVTPAGPGGRYRVDAAAQRLVCADGTPQVCVTAVHAYQLPTVAPAARRALALLARLPDAPTRVVEWHTGIPSTGIPPAGDGVPSRGRTPVTVPGTVLFQVEPGTRMLGVGDLFHRPRLSPAAVTASIVDGAGTTLNGCPPGDRVALGAAGAWLMGVDVLPPGDGRGHARADDPAVQAEIAATVTALRALPEQEQVRRVTALRDAAAACRTDDLRGILTGTPTGTPAPSPTAWSPTA